MLGLFEYPVTRAIKLPSSVRLLLGLLASGYCVVVTLLAVVAVGYEFPQAQSRSYNSTSGFWFDGLELRTFWTPKSKECQGSSIKVNDGIPEFVVI